jgi:hypothetical protein
MLQIYKMELSPERVGVPHFGTFEQGYARSLAEPVTTSTISKDDVTAEGGPWISYLPSFQLPLLLQSPSTLLLFSSLTRYPWPFSKISALYNKDELGR